jgi:hypothetical protein
MKIKKILIIALLLTTPYVLHPTPSLAQQAHISLDPPIVTAKIKPGKSIIVGYTAANLGDPTNLQFIIRPFTPSGQTGAMNVLPQMEGPVQFSLENTDITLEKPFFFASKDKKQAVVRIQVPLGIPDGDYYYVVLAETVPAFSVAGQSTGIASASIGAPLLISITDSGITEVNASVAEFSFKPDYTFTIGNNTVRIVDNSKELPIVCSVRNMGKNLIQPQGVIVDQNGSTKNKYSIIPQNVLSNSQRIIKVFLENESVPQNATVLLSRLTIGTHRVSLELNFGENTPIQYKALTFLALPIGFIKVFFFILLVVALVFGTRYKMKQKK